MPELPEVATIVSDLSGMTKRATITSIKSYWKNLYDNTTKKEFCSLFTEKVILDCTRIGKYLIFTTEGKESFALHLRMSGRILLTGEFPEPSPELSLSLGLSNGIVVNLYDVRHFGKITIFKTLKDKKAFFSAPHLGPDPILKPISFTYLEEQCKNSSLPIKALLMDQSCIAGIGNIYASEILWTAQILPERKANSLKTPEIEALLPSITLILKKAIEKRGTSVSDFFDALGVAGEFQYFLAVYKREGLPCPRCKDVLIKKSILAERSTFFCSKCQK